MDRTARAFLDDLLRAHGPSGHEAPAAEVFRGYARGFARVTADALGSSYAAVGPAQGPAVLLLGHIDEIGLIVTYIEDDDDSAGLLRVRTLGSWDAEVLVGQHVEIRTRAGAPIRGVVGKAPIHLQAKEDGPRGSTLASLWIDIGARDADDARTLVEVGDTVVVAPQVTELGNGRIASKALDNRVGAWVVAEAARRVAADGSARCPVVACAPVLEETLGDGGRAAAHRVDPAVTIVLDGTHATDVPGVPRAGGGRIRLGHGPVLTRGLGLHPRLFDRFLAVASAAGIDCQIEAMPGDATTFTDVDGALDAHAGSAVTLVSVPMRHMHSPSETVALADVDATAELLARVALSLGVDESWER